MPVWFCLCISLGDERRTRIAGFGRCASIISSSVWPTARTAVFSLISLCLTFVQPLRQIGLDKRRQGRQILEMAALPAHDVGDVPSPMWRLPGARIFL